MKRLLTRPLDLCAVLAGGLLGFYVSDLAVLRQRFGTATPWNRIWGVPAYYTAQFLIVHTLGE